MAKDKDKIQERLELLAREAGKNLLAQTVQMFGECEAEYLRDTKGFAFKCSRWGDWLELSVARQANSSPYPEWSYGTTYSGAFLLKNVKIMRLELGHKPDLNGEATFAHYGNDVHPQYSSVPVQRLLFVVLNPDPQQYGSTMAGYGYKIQHKVSSLPRPAEDDRIIFEGVGTLYTPAGYGQDVYEEILSARDTLPATKNTETVQGEKCSDI